MDLQSTPLKGIVRSSEDGLFYLFPIQSLSTLQEMKGHLTCAIDVLSIRMKMIRKSVWTQFGH